MAGEVGAKDGGTRGSSSSAKRDGRGQRLGMWLAGFLYRRRWWVLLVVVAATALAAIRVPGLIANVRVNRAALQDPNHPVRVRFDEVVGRFGTPFLATVVLEGDDREALQRTADGIAAKLTAEPPAGVEPSDPCADARFAHDHVRDVFHKVDLGWFEQRGIYYLAVEEMRKLGEALAAVDRQGTTGMPPLSGLQAALDGILDGFKKGQAAAGADAAKDAETVDRLADALGRLERWLDKPYPEERLGESAAPQLTPEDRRGVDEQGYLSQGEKPIRMFLFVRPKEDSEDESVNRCFTSIVRTVAHGEARRAGAEAKSPVRALVTGTPAVVTDEMTLIAHDAARVTLFSGLAIFLLLLSYYRSLRAPIMLLVPLLLAEFWTLGLVSVTIGRLTLITVYFGGVLMGLGVDYAVQLFQRYNDERLAGREPVEAAGRMLGNTGGAILTAAVMTTLAFIGIGLTEFVGFAELGQIVAMAIWMIFVATIILLPILLFFFHKPRRYGMQAQFGMQWLARHRVVRPVILLLTLGIIAAGGATLRGAWLDWDAMNLLPRSAESVLGAKALSGTDFSPDTAILTGSSPAEIRGRVRRVEERFLCDERAGRTVRECVARGRSVKRIESVERYEKFLPAMSPEKVLAAQEIRAHEDLLERIRREAAAAAASPQQVDPSRVADTLEQITDEAENIAFDLRANEPGSPLTAAISALGARAGAIAAKVRQADPGLAAERLRGFQDWLLGELSGGLRLVLDGLALPELAVRALPPAIDARFRSRDGKSFAAYVYPTGNIGDRDFLPRFVADLQTVDPGGTGFPMTHLVNAREIENSFRAATIYSFVAVVLCLVVYMRRPSHILVTLVPLLFGTTLVALVQYVAGIPFNFVNVMALPVLLCTGVDYGVYLVHRYREDPESTAGFASTSAGVTLCALTTIIGFSMLMISDHWGMWSLGFSLTIGIFACMVAAQLTVPALLYSGRRPGKVP